MSESGSPALSDDASVAAAVGEWAGIWRLLMLPLILLTIAIAGIGIYVYVSARTVVTQKIAADMESIAKLKTGQIEQWLAERRQDLELISTSQLSIDLEHWLAGGASDERLKSRLLAQLRFPGTTDYGTVSLLSPVDGRVLLTSGDPELLPASRTQAMESAWRGFLVFDNIHAAAGGQSEATDIEIFNPVRAVDSQRVLAVIHATLQPDQLLFPLLETWPGASKTAETLLLRREGDDLLFLNGRRRDDGSVWQLRRPLGATTNIFASRLLAEGERFLQADDYRGERVLAYGRPVAGTPWFLVAKVDQAEAYAQFDMAVRIAVALFGALLLVCAWWLFARKQAEMALQRTFAEIDDLYQNAPCGYHSLDENGTFVRINDTELGLLGYRRDEVIGKMRLQDMLTPSSRARVDESFPRFKTSGVLKDLELELVRRDGTILPVLVSATAIRDRNGRYLRSRSMLNDITERKQVEHVQRRLGRALRLLSDCNVVSVCANDESALFDSICRLIVETGGYKMAWIGIPEDDAERRIRIVSSFGDDTGYLASLRVSWADDEFGRGPSGTAIRQEATQVNRDVLNNPAMAPWRDIAEKCGYRSSIALPLTDCGLLSGVLSLYSSDADAFGAEEIKLLEELASDLMLAVQSLRLRNAHVRVRRSLVQAQERLQSLFNSIRDAVFVHGVQEDGRPGYFVEVNDVACTRLGYSRAELLAMSPLDIAAPECHADAASMIERMASHQNGVFEWVHLTRDGRRIPVEISSSTFTLHGQTMFVSLVRDITESKLAKQQLIESADELHRLSTYLETVREEERTYIARELHDELGQMLTALKMDISLLRNDMPAADDATLSKFRSMTAMVDETLDAVRRIASDLRPIMLDELGLKAALEWLIEDFEKRYRGIGCNLVIALDGQTIKGKIATAAYRIVQECLTNVVRHAEASKVHIAVGIDQRQQLFISVQDNGRGLPEQQTRRSGFGLVGMRERVNALKGEFALESIPGDGVSVDVTIPLPTLESRSAAP